MSKPLENYTMRELRLEVEVLRMKLAEAEKKLYCSYSHTSYGEYFHCTKCGFTKLAEE